jgi:hypothetical protein
MTKKKEIHPIYHLIAMVIFLIFLLLITGVIKL